MITYSDANENLEYWTTHVKNWKSMVLHENHFKQGNKLAGSDMGIIIYFSAFCGAFLLEIIARIYEGM